MNCDNIGRSVSHLCQCTPCILAALGISSSQPNFIRHKSWRIFLAVRTKGAAKLKGSNTVPLLPPALAPLLPFLRFRLQNLNAVLLDLNETSPPILQSLAFFQHGSLRFQFYNTCYFLGSGDKKGRSATSARAGST